MDSSENECFEEPEPLPLLRAPSQSDPQPPESTSAYYSALASLRFDSANIMEQVVYKSEVSTGDELERMAARLATETKVLSLHLPCEASGAIFVRVDGERSDCYHAMLSGTASTPYAHGLYLFEVLCPANYPQSPPIVRILTTGHGTLRFNPNLYSDGFVCLSIINTWDGDPSERWNPAHSNILQVLMSIQVLVMDNLIIQKEPDYEYVEDTAPEHRLYCDIVKYGNIKHAMLDVLREPHAAFAEVVQRHFSLKKREILETVNQWVSEAEDSDWVVDACDHEYLVRDHNFETVDLFKQRPYSAVMKELRTELFQELMKLPDAEDIPPGLYEEAFDGLLPQMLTCNFEQAGGFNHSLAHVIGFPTESPTRQIARQLESLAATRFRQEVVVASDSTRSDLLKVLIAGHPDSYYAGGLFLFEVALPSKFPQQPPQVVLKTTGKGSIKFSSLVTHSGQVTVPLLTQWTSDKTLVHLIRSLAGVVAENLTGALDTYGPPRVTTEAILKIATLQHAVIGIMRTPPPEFKDFVSAFFTRQSAAILSRTAQFLNEALMFSDATYSDELLPNPVALTQLIDNGGYFQLMQNVNNELCTLLAVPEEAPPEEAQLDGSLPVLKPATSTDPVAPDSSSTYFQQMAELRLALVPFDMQTHSLFASGQNCTSPQIGPRLTKEMQSLSKHLPCEAGSAVFVAMGAEQMNLVQALISGPEDSPYAFGLYLFDVECPSDYPNTPPQVFIRTTGHGVARFNPNLYSDGFVCLSIINTWSGSAEEMWNPSHSSLLQIFLSIQGLVMDQEVIMKEPGYEDYSIDSIENRLYSYIVRYNNLKYAVVENIRNPPPHFAEVVKRHFALVKDKLLEKAQTWLEDIRDSDRFDDPDPLVSEHNYSTIEIFCGKGLKPAFEEVCAELREALSLV